MPEIRLIDSEGEQLGVLQTRDAMRMADEAGLDLVEVAPHARPPVCRILDRSESNYINPKNLEKNQRDLLKDSFKIINKFKKFMTYHFHLEMVS